MERSRWFSSFVFAAVLYPALLQTSDCGTRTGDTTLTLLELETSGQNQVLGFTADNRSYHVWIPAGVSTATLSAQSTDPAANVTWNWNGTGASLGTGGGVLTLDVPVGSSTLSVFVGPPGGAVASYAITINPTCSSQQACDDSNECTDDVACNLTNGLCPQPTPVVTGTVCDRFATGDGVCDDAGACVLALSQQWGVPLSIETGTGDAENPSVAVDPAGNAVAVWQRGDFMPVEIWASRFTPSGGWGAAELLETEITGRVDPPQVVVDASGRAIAIWEQADASVPDNRTDIWLNRYSPGSGWGGAELLETDDAGDARDPSITMDAAGNAIAVWSQSEGPPALPHLDEVFNALASHYTPAGGWTAPIVLDSSVPSAYGSAGDVQVGLDANGNAVAVWWQDGVWTKNFTNGVGWNSTAALLWFPPITFVVSARSLRLAVDASGNATLVWPGSNSPAPQELRAMRYTAGIGWGTVQVLFSDQSLSARSPDVVAGGTGDALVVWLQTRSSFIDVVIWGQRYSQGAWQAAENIFPGAGNPPITSNGDWVGDPAAAMDGAGNAFAVWRALRPDLEPSIYASRYNVGVGWEAAAPIEVSGPQEIAISPNVAMGADGSAAAVWVERNASFEYDVWAVSFAP